MDAARAQLDKANRLFDAEKWKDAIAAYEQFIGNGWDDTTKIKRKVYFNLAYANSECTGLTRPDRAIEWYTKCIALGPNDPKFVDSYFNRGIEYSEAGHHSSALADFNQALTLFDQSQTSEQSVLFCAG